MSDLDHLNQNQASPSESATSAGGGADVLQVLPVGRPIPPKLYRIGEVVDYSGMSRQTIHNYTTMGLLRESRWTGGGHRLYDESVFGRLDQIIRMKHGNKSMQEIRSFFAAQEPSTQQL